MESSDELHRSYMRARKQSRKLLKQIFAQDSANASPGHMTDHQVLLKAGEDENEAMASDPANPSSPGSMIASEPVLSPIRTLSETLAVQAKPVFKLVPIKTAMARLDRDIGLLRIPLSADFLVDVRSTIRCYYSDQLSLARYHSIDGEWPPVIQEIRVMAKRHEQGACFNDENYVPEDKTLQLVVLGWRYVCEEGHLPESVVRFLYRMGMERCLDLDYHQDSGPIADTDHEGSDQDGEDRKVGPLPEL
ncbi:hypothetical protein S7711_10498 [Stachybotrys chartarum IBT 7711]|uniref:Uncharacterized protein n=1 Tax=Stachybotrys chartarum (strain CBS 109288 / IBT 7711) TaxID=1280523 RepID=A0A084AV57_STACB|nr:hypothetical protein S7711_10498 [Stachybotrys chartarum IBT 7711]